jgi:iron complex outermembrane receptor protein
MRGFISLVLSGASITALAVASPAFAAEQPAPTAAPAEDAVLGEIVVTARRRAESLQEVPQSVTAVSADTLQKLNIQRLEDVTALTPGLSLSSGPSGFSTVVAMRGLSFQAESAASPTVAFYLNDAPAESPLLFQSLFDVGQIEVLRGPQGTVRGIAAPSGALTVTTHKPDLEEVGGYINATVTDLQGRNVNGAVNVPIIKDVMALRVAGIIDQNDFDGVRSINNPLRPRSVTSALRTSLSFEPSDEFNAFITYVHLNRDLRSFAQVTGPGVQTNGPEISARDNLSVAREPSTAREQYDFVTANIDSRIFGQHLSYVGSYGFQKIKSGEPFDKGNIIPNGGSLINRSYSPQERTSHEIRLASDPAPGRFLDYTVGAFYQWIRNDVSATQVSALPGFFGSPFAPGITATDTRYSAIVNIVPPSSDEETSFFGSLTAHLGRNTEITGGGRYIISRNVRTATLTLSPGLYALPPQAVGLAACGPIPSTYPGTCDFTLPSMPAGNPIRKAEIKRPFIYSLSASHHFGEDFLVYANTGSSWRAGPAVIGIFNANNDPTLADLSVLTPEKSKSYEVGFKSTLWSGRARLNVALFRQKFKDLIIRTEPVLYLSAASPGRGTPGLFNFTTQVDALVEGADIDAALQLTPQWNVTASLSYADGRAQHAQIPCNGPIPTGQFVRLCPYNSSTSRDPLWNATVTSEYVRPIRDGMDGFVRGLFNYYPKNPRRSPGADFLVQAYSLLNLYAGVRSQDGAWEVALFAKNALETKKQLSLDANAFVPAGTPVTSLLGTPVSITSGYFGTNYTPRREVGVNVRYAFGSR